MPRTESSPSWLRTPRHLLAGFLIVTLGPACGLVWLGWKLLDQDRALASQRLQERRERAADLAVSSLQQRLAAAESALLVPTGEPLEVLRRDQLEPYFQAHETWMEFSRSTDGPIRLKNWLRSLRLSDQGEEVLHKPELVVASFGCL